MMQCAVCCRSSSGGSKSIFYCPGCARHSLYELRVESARTLLAREAASRKVEDVVLDQKSASLESGGTRTTRYEPQLASIDRDQLEVRTREIKGQAEVLRREIESARVELSTFRSALARRRADYASATYHLDARRNSSLGSMESFIRRTVARADQQSIQTAESRVFLCREAAKLYGLRQRRRKKGDTFQEDYMIGGVGIVNLKDLNSKLAEPVYQSWFRMARPPQRKKIKYKYKEDRQRLMWCNRCSSEADHHLIRPRLSSTGSHLALSILTTPCRDHLASSGLSAPYHLPSFIIIYHSWSSPP